MMMYFVVSIFPFFGPYINIIALIGTIAFLIGIVWANVWPRPFFSKIYFIWALSVSGFTIPWFIAIFYIIIWDILSITYNNNLSIIIFIGLTLFFNLWGIYASWVPKITTYKVNLNKAHNWHGKKIVMIGDTHYGNIYGIKAARKLVERINKIAPEVVLIPGDFFDGPLIDYNSIVKEFWYIDTPHGVLFANGNHEEYTHTKEILKTIKNPVFGKRRQKSTEALNNTLATCHQEITVINNEKVEIDGIIFAWVTYHETETVEWLTKQLDLLNLEEEKPTILLKHKPTLHQTIENYPVDLVVSWHTHQAQMWPFSIVTYMIYGKYVYGKVVQNNLTAITTSGVWSWWPPHRIGTRSEIVVIELI
jgi:predicted MPP superfamily phosphohydrolase